MARSYTLTLRREGDSERQRFVTLDGALDALETEIRAMSQTVRREATKSLGREYEPVELVAVRAEVSGPGVRGGVDLRGDGSVQAFSGRIRRAVIEPRDGEDPYSALRRVLSSD
ncbi:MAG: hypothetical protein JHC46_02240 [Solirubrobacteraceae bacterium]|nr:hypothetical protein [Solirubrobacteraceae bacterium]